MNVRRPSFIVFEGLDGAGKTTCAKELAKRLDAELMTTPPPEVRDYRDELIQSLGESQEARQLFYLSTVFAVSDRVSMLLEQGRSVVLDRYFLSTQAYASFRGSRLDLDDQQRMIRPADFTIFLEASLQTRVERLERRGMTAEDLDSLSPAGEAGLLSEYQRRAEMKVVGRLIQIENEGDSPAEAVERILGELAGP